MKIILLFVILMMSFNVYSTPLTIHNFLKFPHFSKSIHKSFDQKINCRAKIKNLLCVVEEPQGPANRVCQAGGEKYASIFEEIYDHYPPILQRIFCSLDIIYLEKNFEATAYAGTRPDGKSAFMGIKKAVIDENLSLSLGATWKEQLSFGGNTGSYTPLPHLPQINSSSSTNVNDFLYFIMAHEFGHILDFANKLNEVAEGCPKPTPGKPMPVCSMKKDSWGDISWETNIKPRPENDFLYRSDLCFYWCGNKPIDISKVISIYDHLYKTDFISLYATTQPWDDFADSFAYMVMDQNLKSTYVIDSAQGPSYDIIKKLHSSIFNKKAEYIQKLLK